MIGLLNKVSNYFKSNQEIYNFLDIDNKQLCNILDIYDIDEYTDILRKLKVANLLWHVNENLCEKRHDVKFSILNNEIAIYVYDRYDFDGELTIYFNHNIDNMDIDKTSNLLLDRITYLYLEWQWKKWINQIK